MYFEIIPFETGDCDVAIMPANSEDDYNAAFEYAKARLNNEFDNLIGELKQHGFSRIIDPEIRVSIKLCDGEPPIID
ncbi:MAG: hypothetical protein CV087_08225 [Candidatus Brocadia sp. WS118]|nr:MAG: hypothetical protein CV087_08225 [Candidatus Brocadia sp. WS118]